METPRKWWWIGAAAVPITVAVIGAVATLLAGGESRTSPQAPTLSGVSYVNYGGTQVTSNVHGDVAYNRLSLVIQEVEDSLGSDAAAQVSEMLEEAMQLIEAGQVQSATPLLEAAAEAAPVPAVLNNLGAAYTAAGRLDKARMAFEQTEAAQTINPQTLAATRHNLTELQRQAQSPQPPPAGWRRTFWDGIVATVTRSEQVGAILTIELLYRNAVAEATEFCLTSLGGYIIDEQTGTKWGTSTYSGGLINSRVAGAYWNGSHTCRKLAPEEPHVAWMKFRVKDTVPPRFTLVVDYIHMPFEGLVPTVGAPGA